MNYLRHLNFALIAYCMTLVVVKAEPNNFLVTADVVASTEFRFQNHTQDVKSILQGLDSFFVDKNMGTLSVYGQQAFSIAVGQTGKNNKIFHPIIACGTMGRGKVVGIADSIFLNVEYPYTNNGLSSQRNLTFNTVQWASSKVAPLKKLHIGFYRSCCTYLNSFLRHRKLNTSNIKLNTIINPSILAEYDVVVVNSEFFSYEIPIILEYVRKGGILIMGQPARGQHSSGHFGLSYPANIISSHAGFVWKNSSDKLIFDKDDRILTLTDRLQYTHFLDAWSIIKDLPKGFNATVKQAWATVESGLVSIPPNDPFWEENLPLIQTLHKVLKRAISA